MRKILNAATVLLLLSQGILFAQQTQPTQTAPAMSDQEKRSYSIGLNIGMNLYEQEVQIDIATLTKGIQDGLSDSKPAISEEEIKAALMTLQKEVMDRQEAKKKTMAADNQKKSGCISGREQSQTGRCSLAKRPAV